MNFGFLQVQPAAAKHGLGPCCRWLAPEILAGLPYTVAADVYSFGVIMWELLTWEVRGPLFCESGLTTGLKAGCSQTCVLHHCLPATAIFCRNTQVFSGQAAAEGYFRDHEGRCTPDVSYLSCEACNRGHALHLIACCEWPSMPRCGAGAGAVVPAEHLAGARHGDGREAAS